MVKSLKLAATITPLANPKSVFCSRSGISFFIKKTKADPSIVPSKGSVIPIISAFMPLKFHSAKIVKNRIWRGGIFFCNHFRAYYPQR